MKNRVVWGIMEQITIILQIFEKIFIIAEVRVRQFILKMHDVRVIEVLITLGLFKQANCKGFDNMLCNFGIIMEIRIMMLLFWEMKMVMEILLVMKMISIFGMDQKR